MTTLSSHNPFQLDGRTRNSSTHGGLRRLITQLAGRWAKRRDYRDTIARLRALSDRELDDIGITRIQIEIIAHQSTYEQG